MRRIWVDGQRGLPGKSEYEEKCGGRNDKGMFLRPRSTWLDLG